MLCSTLRLVGARPAAPRLAGIGRLRETAISDRRESSEHGQNSSRLVQIQWHATFSISTLSGWKCSCTKRRLLLLKEERR